jgi:glycine cleavage system regulatory protein
MTKPETPLEKARRYVAEAEAKCAQQAEILREVITADHPEAAEKARHLLATLEISLELMRCQLQREEERAARGAA